MTDILDSAGVIERLPWPRLIDGLRETFRGSAEQPVRTSHTIKVPDEPDATLLMMPAWQEGGKLAVKLAYIAPGNASRNMPAVSATVALLDARTGAVEAILDGGEITARRTAAASALAADYLAGKDAETLLIVGAGRIAENLIHAHMAVRAYRRVLIWARRSERAAELAAQSAVGAIAMEDIDAAVGQADTISCATITSEPLVAGKLVKPGTHIDLVGGYLPTMRETDDDAIRRAAGNIYVDTYDGALSEAGDLVQPLAQGIIQRADIAGDLAELCRGTADGRRRERDITVFKSVGAAIEDFAAAKLAAG